MMEEKNQLNKQNQLLLKTINIIFTIYIYIYLIIFCIINNLYMIYFIFLTFLYLILQTNQTFKKITPGDPQALCLDGSPSVMYISPGLETKKFLIHFYGGGSCGDVDYQSTIQNCYQRTQTIFGTSTLWPDELPGQAFFNVNQLNNAYFYNWTLVAFAYCDGSFYQGYKKDPIQYNNTNLYFRGQKIVKQNFDFLNKQYELYHEATDVILSGSSAGAIAVSMWSNYLKKKLKNAKYKLILDSVLLLNRKNYETGQSLIETTQVSLIKIVNEQVKTPFKECNKLYKQELWKCFNIQFTYQYIKGDILIIQSQYDIFEIPFVLGINCIISLDLSNCSQIEMTAIQNYRLNQFFPVLYNLKQQSKISIWSISCANHVYAQDYFYQNINQTVHENSNNTLENVLKSWYFNNKRILEIDEKGWPNNKNCAYIRDF